MISTRGRYAMRVLIDLAEHREEGFLPMKDVAARQGISLKYLEQIMPILTRAGLVEAIQGKGGGYRLTREPEDYKMGELLRLTEGTLASVACLAEDAPECQRAAGCRTLFFWQGLDKVIYEYVDGISLADFLTE